MTSLVEFRNAIGSFSANSRTLTSFIEYLTASGNRCPSNVLLPDCLGPVTANTEKYFEASSSKASIVLLM